MQANPVIDCLFNIKYFIFNLESAEIDLIYYFVNKKRSKDYKEGKYEY